MPDILDKIFYNKKVELDTVKRKLSLPDVKILIDNKTNATLRFLSCHITCHQRK